MWRRSLPPNLEQAARTSPAEIAEAMNNGRRLANQLRDALDLRNKFGPTMSLKQAGSLREAITALRADLRSVADRAFIDVDVLICLLDAEHAARPSNGRKPSAQQLQRAIARRVAETERFDPEAQAAATIAQERAAQATRDRVAAAAARHLIGAWA